MIVFIMLTNCYNRETWFTFAICGTLYTVID